MSRLFKIGSATAVVVFFIFTSIILSVRMPYRDRMYIEHPNLQATIIVLGGRVEEDGTPSDWLANRVKKAVELQNEQGGTVLLSGDNGWKRADEISAMRTVPPIFREELNGVPKKIQEDGLVGRTIDSCWRAKNVLKIDSAILITQKFHMPRALYLCNKLGVDSYGVIAPNGEKNLIYSNIRDWLASVKAWWDIQTGYVPVHAQDVILEADEAGR